MKGEKSVRIRVLPCKPPERDSGQKWSAAFWTGILQWQNNIQWNSKFKQSGILQSQYRKNIQWNSKFKQSGILQSQYRKTSSETQSSNNQGFCNHSTEKTSSETQSSNNQGFCNHSTEKHPVKLKFQTIISGIDTGLENERETTTTTHTQGKKVINQHQFVSHSFSSEKIPLRKETSYS